MHIRGLVLLLLAWPAWGVALEAEQNKSIDGHFKGWADIDASGHLQSFTPDGKAHPAVAQALLNELQRIGFTPARTDAANAPIHTYLTGEYRLVPDADNYALQLKSVRTGPRPLTVDMPQPPRRLMTMDEASWVRVSFAIDRSGRVKGLIVEASGGATELRRNVAKSMQYWRFEPESINGAPIETVVRQEVAYFNHDQPPPSLPPCPADDGHRVLAPEQSSCLFPMSIQLGEPRMGRSISVP